MENFLIVGLGNPGNNYKESRHNIGFMVLEELLKNLNLISIKNFSFNKKLNVELSKIKDSGNIYLIKPLSFMNLSGIPTLATKKYFDIDLSNILIVHDDLDLPFGQIKISKNSGAGGHNGVKSIIEHLHSKDFSRLRIGISTGLSRQNIPTEKFVLSNFSKEEQQELKKIISSCCECIKCFIEHGMEKTMNEFN